MCVACYKTTKFVVDSESPADFVVADWASSVVAVAAVVVAQIACARRA